MLKTREQQRGALAYQQIEKLSGLKDDKKKAYGRLAHKLPILIRQAGLAQALSFATAKGSDGSSQLLEHLGEYLHGAKLIAEPGAAGLRKASRELELLEYQVLTREALAALVWYKRYAQSVLGVEQGSEDGQ